MRSIISFMSEVSTDADTPPGTMVWGCGYFPPIRT
jgi:hypothetical protein